MADPESLQVASRLLHDLVSRDHTLARWLRVGGDEPVWNEARLLLERRLERAAAENAEAVRLGVASSSEADRRAIVVREILQGDLASEPERPSGPTINECSELVLTQREVTPQLYSDTVRRCYAIQDGVGRELGEVQQVANPARPEPRSRSALDLSDLCFHVADRTNGQTFRFRRSGDQLYILDEVDTQLGFVHFKATARAEGFKIVSSLDRGMMQVNPMPEAPFSLRVTGSLGDDLGRIERQYVGLGPLLSASNQMRLRAEPARVSPGQRLGLVAAALLAGIDDEPEVEARRSVGYGS